MKSVVVIPAYNEGKVIAEVINDIKKCQFNDVIVVDDGSSDDTYETVKKIDGSIIALRHRINLGKGAALKTGCEAAIKLGADIIVFMDSDGQHKPEDISRFIEKMEKENLDIVFGSRKIGKDMPLMMMLGNKFISITIALLFKMYISDTQSGFRAIRSSIYPKIKWNSTRYAVETEMIINTSKKKLKFGEIEIQTIYHDNYKGTTIFDGLRIFYNILMWRII